MISGLLAISGAGEILSFVRNLFSTSSRGEERRRILFQFSTGVWEKSKYTYLSGGYSHEFSWGRGVLLLGKNYMGMRLLPEALLSLHRKVSFFVFLNTSQMLPIVLNCGQVVKFRGLRFEFKLVKVGYVLIFTHRYKRMEFYLIVTSLKLFRM